jgi:outer membrane protein
MALLASGTASAATLSLNDALGLAYETNPELDSQRAAQRGNDEGVAQAHAGWRPTINLNGSYGYESLSAQLQPRLTLLDSHPIEADITLAQNIYRGGRTEAEVSKAKAIVRAGVAQLQQTEIGVLLDASTTYLDVVRDETIFQLRKETVAALQKQLQATKDQFGVGELTRTDVAQAQARLAGAEADLVNAQGQLNVSRSNFEHVIGRPPETLETDPAMPKLPISEEQAVEIATHDSPAIVGARENWKAADYAVQDALGALLPQISVNAQYQLSQGSLDSQQGTGTQHLASVIGQITVPIYQGGADESGVRQAKDQRAQAELGIVDAQRQTNASTRTAWQAYTAATASIEADKAEVRADEVAFQGVKQEQQVGSRTVLDVLNAQQELSSARIGLASALHDAHIAAYELLGSMGWLTAKKLNLRVQIYDPAENYNDNAARWFGFGK